MMKKIFALVFILVLGKMSYSQGYPISQNLGSDSTIVISKGALQSRLAPIVISDTTAANNQRIKNYPGAQLYTANGDFYVRNATATKWVLVSSGSSGPINIYTIDGTLTGTRNLSGSGFPLTFSGLDKFVVSGDSIRFTAGNQSFALNTDSGSITKKLSYSGNYSGDFKQYTLVDKNYVDSVVTSSPAGTVTQINTSYGLLGGPITNTGTLSVDSATLSNYYLRRNDSLTATNSLGYVTKKILADTAAAIRSSSASGFVPYVGATQNVNLGQFGLKTEYVEFDTTTRAVTDRTLSWSDADGTLNLGMTNGGSLTQKIGLQQFARVKNVDTVAISKGQAVYIFGASGDRASVKLATNKGDSTSSKVLGVAAENIPINDVGLVGTFGTISNLNLSAFTAGNILYLDSIPGKLTANKPQAPYHLVFVGVVERANAGNGLLFVNPQNGYELDELHNVRITSPVPNRAILTYDSVQSLWVDTTLNAIGGITGSGTSGQVSYFNGTNSITSSPTFAFTPTSQLLVNNSITASSSIARGINATPTLTAAANNDVLVGLEINPTFTLGAFTGTNSFGLTVRNGKFQVTNGWAGNNSTTDFAYFGNPLGNDQYVALDALGTANNGFILRRQLNEIWKIRRNSSWNFEFISANISAPTFTHFYTTGNTFLGQTPVDGGFRLDVNGTARVQGNTTMAGTSNSSSGLFTIGGTGGNNQQLSLSAVTFGVGSNSQSIRIQTPTANPSSGSSYYAGIDINGSIISASGTYSGSMFGIRNAPASIAIASGFYYGVYSTALAAATNVWNIYADGTANNYFGGNILIGTTTPSGANITTASSLTASSGIARGVNFTNTLVAAANNDVLVGLDINPTFTNGAFTGLTNYAARFSDNLFITNNRNNDTEIRVSNTTSNTASKSQLGAISSGGSMFMQKTSALFTTYKIINGGDGGLYNTSGDLYFLTEAVGNIKFAAGASSTVQMRLFANGNLGINQNTDAGFRLDVNGTARVQGAITGTAGMTLAGLLNNSANEGRFNYLATGGAAANTSYGITVGAGRGILLQSGGNTIIDFANGSSNNLTLRSNTTNLNSFGALVFGNTTADRSFFTMDLISNTALFADNIGIIATSIPMQASALVAMNSTTKGFLQPRMTTAQRDAISTPATGLSVYNTSTNTNDYYNGSAWLNVGQVLVPANNTTGFSISGSSLTGSNAQSLVSLSQTWNTTGNPTAFLLNITNTASGATSNLIDLQVGAATRFQVSGAGRARLGAYGSGTITGTATYNLAVDASGNVIEVTGGGGGGIGGSGTTNYVPKFTASTTLGNSLIFDTGTGIVIGNGQSSATPQLGLIEGTDGSGTNIAGAEFRIQGGQGTGTGAGGPITFYTSAAGTSGSATNSATERMRIDAAGNVGIVNAASAWAGTNINALQIGNASIYRAGNIESGYSVNTYYDGTNFRYISTGIATNYTIVNGVHAWQAVASGTAGATFSWTRQMTLDASGNLGINTITIGSRLQVNGGAAIGYSASTAAPTNGLSISGNTTIGTITAAGKFTIDPDDNQVGLAITGTSLTGSNAQSLIDLAQTWNTTGNPTAIKLNITNTASGTGADLMELQVGGVSQFFVSKTGSGYFKDLLTIEPQTANTGAIKTDGYSLTGSNAQALLSMTGTWNTTGNPTAIKLDITNTASGSSSYLMDLLVGGTTQFRVAKDGAIRTTAPTGGTADNWKFGTKVASSVVFDDNDYLEVEVGGTLYRVALVNLAEPEPEAIPASTPEDRRINLPAKTSSQRIQELENEIQELKQMIKFLMPTSKNKK